MITIIISFVKTLLQSSVGLTDYNQRQFFLGRLLKKATESGSLLLTSAHLLLLHV